MKAIAADAKAKHIDNDMSADNVHSIDDIANRINSDPRTRAILAAHGMSARESVIANFAVMNAMMAISMEGTPEAKLIHPEDVNQANIAFVRQHMAEVQQLMTSDDN